MIEIRKGQAPATLTREALGERCLIGFVDPAFVAEEAAIARLEDIARQACDEGRMAPYARWAGPGYADPSYALSVEWFATRQAIDQAQLAWGNSATPSRVRPSFQASKKRSSRRSLWPPIAIACCRRR